MLLSEKTGVGQKTFTIALAGQPNTGKSTIFNFLTGSNQHVGNWPGKTVEKKEGWFTVNGTSARLVDLPGTYSLSANSTEEIIARDYIVHNNPDLVVVVVDASQLTRSLYLVSEALPLGVPLVVALNMMDVAHKKGLAIDTAALEANMGVKVVPMTASRNIGIAELCAGIDEAVTDGKTTRPHLSTNISFAGETATALRNLETAITGSVPDGYELPWVAQKLLEGDREISGMMNKRMDKNHLLALKTLIPENSRGASVMANARYAWIKQVLDGCVRGRPGAGTAIRRSFFDKLATHPVTGAFLGLLVTLIGFVLAAAIAMTSVSIVHPLFVAGAQWVQSMAGEYLPMLTAFVCQGLVPGVRMIFGVSVFIFGLMFFIGFLEDIGYLPRMAYVADIFMSRIGLPGKSIMPLFMGFGCNIGAVMGCRVVESTRQRFKTIVISSHVPCPGVMMTIAFIIGIFFGPIAPVIVAATIAALLLQTLLSSFLLDVTVLKRGKSGMIMELPPYHLPNWRTIWNYVWLHFKAFLQKAGSLILAIIVVVWALSYFPTGNMADSYLAIAGRALEPVGRLMGMDWKLLTCLFVATFSKEAALISMAVLFGLQDSGGSLTHLMMADPFPKVGSDAIGHYLATTVSKPSALAFIFAILFSVPCYATIAAIYYETKSLRWTFGSVAYYTALSLLWGIGAYQVGIVVF